MKKLLFFLALILSAVPSFAQTPTCYPLPTTIPALGLSNCFTATNIFTGPLNYYPDSGSANAYVITTGAALSAIQQGATFTFRALNTNTGASTLKVDNSAAAPIVKFGSVAIASADIVAGRNYSVSFDGTSFEVMSALGSSAGTGTLTNISVTATPSWLNVSILNPATTPAFTFAGATGVTSHQFVGSCGLATAISLCALQASDIPALPYISSSLTSARILVGNGSNVATAVALSGDGTLSNAGAFTLAASGVSAGSCGDATHSCGLTIDAKGRVTAQSNSLISAGSNITVNGGSTLPSPANFRNQTTPFNGISINFSNPSLGNVEATLSGTATEALLPATTAFSDQNFTYGAHTFSLASATSLVFPATANISGLYYQTAQVGGTPVTQEPAVNYVAGTNVTITPSIVGSVTTLTFAATNTAATAWSAITAATNSNAGSFSMSGNTLDLTAAAAALMPVSAAYAPTTDGSLGVNSTNHHWVFGSNGSTLTLPLTATAVSHQFLTSYTQGTGAFTLAQPAFTDISGTATVGQGGTGAATLTAHGVLMGEGALAIGVSAAGTSGFPFLSGGASADGAYAALSLAGSGVTGLLPHANIASTAVTPGSYTNANITVAADGSITAAANGSAGSGNVTATGSPATGNLAKFSGATSITNGDLSGDCATSGTLVLTCTKLNGVSYGASPATNTVAVVTGTNATTYERVPAAVGGTNVDSSASTGVPYLTAGSWAFSNTIPAAAILGNGITATTQTTGENTAKVATDAFVNASITAGGFATTTLNNVGSAAVSAALSPGTDNSISLDTLTKRYVNSWWAGIVGWTNGSGSADLGLSRDAAGVLDLGNGTAGDHTAKVQAANYVAGTAPSGVTGSGGFACTEAAGTGWTPTSGTDYIRCDSATHTMLYSANGSSEASLNTGGGGISGLTTGFLPKAASGTTIADSHCDDGVSVANTFSCSDTGGMAIGAATTALYTSKGANQDVEVGSGNGSGDDGGTGKTTIQNMTLKPAAFSTLASCVSGLAGRIAAVNDSTTQTWGATVTGGSSSFVIAVCDGSNWTVMGK